MRAALRGLDGDHRVGALATGRHEEVVEVLDGGLRMEREHRALELLGADGLGHVARHEQERVTDAQLAAPDIDARGVVRAAGEAGHGPPVRHEEAGVADEIRLDPADRGEVELVVADDRDADAERARGEAGTLAARRAAVGRRS